MPGQHRAPHLCRLRRPHLVANPNSLWTTGVWSAALFVAAMIGVLR